MITAKDFTGGPLFNPGAAFGNAIYGGDVTPPTTTEFTSQSTSDDFRVVFKGTFTVVGGDITGGTVESFTVYAGSTKVEMAKGYAIDAAALYDAFQTDDFNTIEDLLFNVPVKYTGSNMDDRAFGSDFADKLIGKDGNDYLGGSLGDDVIKGGKGNDGLAGGEGSDLLKGGKGDDVFYFEFDSMAPPTSHDKIADFKPGHDHISLSDWSNTLPAGYLDKSHFHVGTEAKTEEQVVIYDKKHGKIFYDADGSGAGAQFLLATVKDGTKIHADDFFVGGGALMIA